MQTRRQPWTMFFCTVSLTALLGACGQQGDLYLAKDDPERAERDARGRGAPFPFPEGGRDFPPTPAPAPSTASDQAVSPPATDR